VLAGHEDLACGGGEVGDEEAEGRDEAPQVRGRLAREVDAVVEASADAPPLLAVVDDDREDRGEVLPLGIGLDERLPDLDLVAEEREAAPLLGAALVLVEEIDPDLAAQQLRGEEPVDVVLPQRLVDEAPGFGGQGVDALASARRGGSAPSRGPGPRART